MNLPILQLQRQLVRLKQQCESLMQMRSKAAGKRTLSNKRQRGWFECFGEINPSLRRIA